MNLKSLLGVIAIGLQVDVLFGADPATAPAGGVEYRDKLRPHAKEEALDRGEWETLFGGGPRAVEGFRLYNLPGARPERWHVAGEALTLVSRDEAPGKRQKEDLVITARGYGDFELRLDWKASPGANGGIFYKVVEDARFDKPWHTGLEYQLLDDAKHKEGKIETHRAGDLYDLIASTQRVARPALAWNQSRIVVRGTKIEHWLNGVLIVAADTASADWRNRVADSKYVELPHFAQPVAGHIVLQDHGDRMWFRNILIREI